MQRVHEMGICFLADLMDKQKVTAFKSLLLRAWQMVFLFDSTWGSCIQSDDHFHTLLANGNNPRYWEKLNKTNPRQFRRERNEIRKLSEQMGENRHRILGGQIEKEFDFLLSHKGIAGF